MAKNNIFIFYLLFHKLFSINSISILDSQFFNMNFLCRLSIIIYVTEM